jgi:hypothetical protein
VARLGTLENAEDFETRERGLEAGFFKIGAVFHGAILYGRSPMAGDDGLG